MNSIAKYIDWAKIWSEEVQIKNQIEYASKSNIENLKNFVNDDKVELDFSECEIQDDDLLFQFSETGGQNESDTQGWYRSYWFKVNPEEDFLINDSGYEQG